MGVRQTGSIPVLSHINTCDGENMTHYYLYEVKNSINGKIYVGVHQTSNIDDGYMGSGAVIKRAIKKYGIENFIKTILETFDDAPSMYQREREIVTDEFLTRPDVYNVRRGGLGGFDHLNDGSVEHIERTNRGRITCQLLRRGVWDPAVRRLGQAHMTPEIQRKATTAAAQPDVVERRKLKYNQIQHQRGSKNSQFGTCWVWHELVGSKKIQKELLPLYIEQGWSKGRKL